MEPRPAGIPPLGMIHSYTSLYVHLLHLSYIKHIYTMVPLNTTTFSSGHMQL